MRTRQHSVHCATQILTSLNQRKRLEVSRSVRHPHTVRTHSQSLNGVFALFSLVGMRKGNGRQRFGRALQEPRPASRRRNTQFKNSSTPLCLFEVSCPLWRSESLSSQHQDSMSPRESEATQAERPGLVFDSPHGSARFRSGIPRTTPCSSTGTVLSAFCAPLDGPFWTPKDNVLFPSTEIGSMDSMRAAGI